MSRYCLDTSAYSHFKRGHVPVVELIDPRRRIPPPVILLARFVVVTQHAEVLGNSPPGRHGRAGSLLHSFSAANAFEMYSNIAGSGT